MQNDRLITITTGANRKSTTWQAQTLLWSEFLDKLRVPVRGAETLDQYKKLPKSRQDDLKDVGGFVAGTLEGHLRKAAAVTGRDIVTLDLDNIPAGKTTEILQRLDGLQCAYGVYSTRKHEEASPRLRVLLPLDRSVSTDEYEPIARRLAEYIGLNLCDPTTFQAARLMYWPSCCSDSAYVFSYGDKPFVSADGILRTFADWRDVTQWPEVPGQQSSYRRLANRQGDPTEKNGVVGAFCRQYDVPAAMDAFIPGEYAPCDTEGRYTYTGGSTTGGAVLYDDGKFLYSHHATDPAGGRLCNAFDLVRLHLFGKEDEAAEPGTPVNRLPSYTLMSERALQDEKIRTAVIKERYSAKDDFEPVQEEDTDWIRMLQMNSKGEALKTIDNVRIIVLHDPKLRGRLAFDTFRRRMVCKGDPWPWGDCGETYRVWTDTDDAGMRAYIEKQYGIIGKDRIYDGVALAAEERKFNDLQDYLKRLVWDGVCRVSTLLVDYLGAENTEYVRAVARKSLAAAVARGMRPGVKYDYMPVLGGPQGIGKSTLLKILGGDWYSDSLTTFEGKEAAEMIQGTWINEVGELASMNRSETNAVKQFLSKTEDIYRKAYGRRTEIYPRNCVFFGTTNDQEYLRDATGNRRFWPVDCARQKPTKSVFEDLPREVHQIWAEAVTIWRAGESLYLPKELEEQAMAAQEEHMVANSKEGLIEEYLQTMVPDNWDQMSPTARQGYLRDEFKVKTEGRRPMQRVCAIQIWVECLGQEQGRMRQTDAREINSILAKIPGWERYYGLHPGYGKQRGFRKETDAEKDTEHLKKKTVP